MAKSIRPLGSIWAPDKLFRATVAQCGAERGGAARGVPRDAPGHVSAAPHAAARRHRTAAWRASRAAAVAAAPSRPRRWNTLDPQQRRPGGPPWGGSYAAGLPGWLQPITAPRAVAHSNIHCLL